MSALRRGGRTQQVNAPAGAITNTRVDRPVEHHLANDVTAGRVEVVRHCWNAMWGKAIRGGQAFDPTSPQYARSTQRPGRRRPLFCEVQVAVDRCGRRRSQLVQQTAFSSLPTLTYSWAYFFVISWARRHRWLPHNRVSAATRNCPVTATKVPAGGHEFCPVAVTGSARM